jgi:peptidoglycan hydrolase CwlO-like protein
MKEKGPAIELRTIKSDYKEQLEGCEKELESMREALKDKHRQIDRLSLLNIHLQDKIEKLKKDIEESQRNE